MQIRSGNLATIRQAVQDALLAKIEAARATGEPLEEVASVHMGDKAHVGDLNLPAVWVLPAPYMPIQRGGHTAEHPMAYDIAVLVHGDDPGVGRTDALDLAARCYDVLLADRTLGGEVHDVRGVRVDPAFRAAEGPLVYWASVQVECVVRRRE